MPPFVVNKNVYNNDNNEEDDVTLAPVTSLSRFRLRPWAFSMHQLAIPWLILEEGSYINTRRR